MDLAMFEALNTMESADWTEYTLYWIHACMTGKIKGTHWEGPAMAKYCCMVFEESVHMLSTCVTCGQ